jgi:chromosome segregation ATPase
MRTRDTQLEKLGEEFASNLQRKRQKEDRMKEKKKEYDDHQAKNSKIEADISATDRQLVRVRLDHMNVKTELSGFKDEVAVLHNQLSACETERTNTKNKHAVMSKHLDHKKEKYQMLHRTFVGHQRSLQDEQQNTKDKDAKSGHVEQAHSDSLSSLRLVEKEMKTAKENLFKESQELYRLRAEEATTLGEISGAQSAIKNLQFQISRLDQERQRQQELLYAVDFQSQLMQRKVARVSGERTVEEREEFNRRIEKLDKDMDEQKSLHTILSQQIKRQDAELKTANRTLADIKKNSEGMKGTMEELELQNTIMNRSVATVVKEKEESLMQHDILRLEVKRLRQQMNGKAETLYSLENRKQQLQISMEEREKEIEVHQEVLKAQIRSQEEERHKTAIELAERKQKIYNLKMKYENVLNKVKKEDGEEQHSQAYYVLKAAQEKEEMQRKGDELDDKIRRAEREIRALENTLGHLLTRNRKYKENFQTANQQNQTELEEKQMLEEQSRAANEVLFKKKKQLSSLEKDGEVDAQRYKELEDNLDKLHATVQELNAEKDQIRMDLDAQLPKMDRAKQTLETSKRRARDAGVPMEQDSAQLLDIQSRNLRDQNQSFVHSMDEALKGHPEDVYQLFEQLCNDKGITRPSRPPSANSVGSRPQSQRSSFRGSPPP